MALGPALTPRQTTTLRLTPGMRRGLAVLRMPAGELAAELARAAEENPLIRLEEAAPGTPGAPWRDADTLAAPETLREQLSRQLALMALDPAVAAIARFLLGDLSEDGYLDPEAAGNALALGAAAEQVETAIAAIQGCEPTGVGARDLAECLALQMRERGVPWAEARAACAHLDLLAEGRLDDLSRATGLSRGRLRTLAEMLPTLSPHPAGGQGEGPLPPLPEITIEETGDGLFRAVLDARALPRPRFDAALARRLGTGARARAARDEALALVQAVSFRDRTLAALAGLIITHQHRFFAEGPEHLVPMTRADLARALDLHPSTVGRALRGKALSFRGAVHPLSRFVSPPLGRSGAAEPVTAYGVEQRIRRLVAGERPGAVLSDDDIAAALRREGIDIARRTVAKYRGRLNIPSSFQRKRRKAAQDAGTSEPR